MFRTHDCTLVEVNPLAETPDGRVVVCDAKINFDDNAEFRQKAIHTLRDRSQEDPREVEAAKHDLNYIGLTGNIGCMVNGAGKFTVHSSDSQRDTQSHPSEDSVAGAE